MTARKTAVKDEPFIEPEAPEAVAVKAEKAPEEDPVSGNPDEADPDFEGDAYRTDELLAEPVVEDYWYPGRPCQNCSQSGYTWTVGWGKTCSLCAPENEED
jgi:hypothetical protein